MDELIGAVKLVAVVVIFLLGLFLATRGLLMAILGLIVGRDDNHNFRERFETEITRDEQGRAVVRVTTVEGAHSYGLRQDTSLPYVERVVSLPNCRDTVVDVYFDPRVDPSVMATAIECAHNMRLNPTTDWSRRSDHRFMTAFLSGQYDPGTDPSQARRRATVEKALSGEREGLTGQRH